MNDTKKPAPAAPSAPRKPRTQRTEPAPGTFAARVRDTMHRLNLDEREAADYLGVPVFTLRKWTTGERQPGAAVLRLFDVLGMVEALAPALHTSFLPPESRHVEKSRFIDSIGSSADSVMSKNPV